MMNGNKKEIKISLKRKLWFKFEDTLSKGTIAIIIWLTILTVLLSLLFGLIVFVFDSRPTSGQNGLNFIEAFWQSFLHIIDTGTIGVDETWSYRIIALFSTLLGVFIFSTLISVLTTGLDKLFITIRKGKSEIILKDFTLILGWSPTIFKIISELVLANANQKGRSIVVLAQKDKIEMEDEIYLRINQKELINKTYKNSARNPNKSDSKYYQSKIVCRTGNLIDLNDLKMVHPINAKSIIILPTNDLNSDTTIIKCILALDSQKVSKKIITEIKDKHNKQAIDFCFNSSNTNKIYIPSIEWLSKVTAQTSRQPGYSLILTELLNYETNEIYFQNIPDELIGKSFETALVSCKSSIILGLIKKQIDPGGFRDKIYEIKEKVILNPLAKCVTESLNRIFEEGDKLILLQLDDDIKLEFTDLNYKIDPILNKTDQLQKESRQILILGWNERIFVIVNELFDYVSENSEILIVADIQNKDDAFSKLKSKLKFKNLNIKLISGDTTDYKTIENCNIHNFNSIIILGYENLNIQEKDGKSILTILHIRRILKNVDKSIVAEIYDEKNRAIVELSKSCDYIISENIISSLMTQLSEQEKLFWIFEEIFDNKGCEIYLKPISNYITNFEKAYDFYDLLKSAANKNEIAIGYRLMKNKENLKFNYGVVINPKKDEQIKYSNFDLLVVIGIKD